MWNWLEQGASLPMTQSRKQRFALWLGLQRARKHANVTIDSSAKISPYAMIHPRNGQISIGAGSAISPGAVIQGNVKIGANSTVQSYSIITGYGTTDDQEGMIVIGNNVRIASHVMIIGANHRFDDPHTPICKQGLKRAQITIEDDVWIAGNANIISGVTVGTGSIIAAGAVVTRNVAPFSVVGGVPAKVLKWRKAP